MRYLQYLCSRQLVRMLKPVCSYLRLRVPDDLSLAPWHSILGMPPPPFRMAPSSCQHLDPPLPHLTCLRERPNLHMGTRTMRGWPRAWAVSYTQSRCITWALPERPEMLDTLLFSIKKTHEISPGVRRSCPPRGCYPVTTGRGYGHLGVS